MKYQVNDIIGVNPIIAAPFDKYGEIDEQGFSNIISYLNSIGVNGATLFGVASEFAKFNDYERDLLADIYLNQSEVNFYKALSVTDHSTKNAIKRAKKYEQLGAGALMLLPPFFLNPSQAAVEKHIQEVLESVSIPVMLQYAPNETGFLITPSKMAQWSEIYPNAVFKIECNPPTEYTQEFLSYVPDAVVLNGYAGLYMLDMLDIGGKGVMPGCSFSEIYVEMYRLWVNKEKDKAQKLHGRLLKYINQWMTHCEYIIQVEKTILNKRGILKSDYCRRPNYSLNNDDMKTIAEFMNEFNLTPINGGG
ncbi:TPA: dihydrodipicolinate synthase family protein [Providencia rettgeri]|nr:dihydrodipicolinate synthase family protein [Providencia rettgeri]